MVEEYWQEKTELFGGKTFPLPLLKNQDQNELYIQYQSVPRSKHSPSRLWNQPVNAV